LLEVPGVTPPSALVGQTYGGVLVREFLSCMGRRRWWVVIMDSAVERTKLPDDWPTLLGDALYGEAVGLEKNRVLTDEEWKEMKRIMRVMR
jgi:hypothetical protein